MVFIFNFKLFIYKYIVSDLEAGSGPPPVQAFPNPLNQASSNPDSWGQIDGISGATISVHSVTKGIRKLTLLMEYFLNSQP